MGFSVLMLHEAFMPKPTLKPPSTDRGGVFHTQCVTMETELIVEFSNIHKICERDLSN